MICKKTIQQRKKIYGNNFPQISKLQSEYYGYTVTPQQVAMSLAILKSVRIDFIKNKLQELKESLNFSDYTTQIEIKDLNIGLEDSKKDYENYLWIANNYKEYEAL